MAQQLPGEIGAGIADVGRSLMPTQAGAAAGGRTLGRLGDVGTFASGGLTGPMGVPTPTGIGRGLINRPSLAPGAPRPMQRPQLALPPPTMQAAGRPAMSTGQGMIPPGPGATMTAPSATPAAGAAAAPLIPPGATMGKPSQLANAFLSNDANAVDRATTRRYRGLMNPRGPGRMNLGGLTTQDQQITTAVDTMIEAKDQLRFKNEFGQELPSGRTPANLDEFVQGIDHMKNEVFAQYNDISKRITGQGVRVPLAPVAAKLRETVAQPQFRIEPALAEKAERMAQELDRMGALDPQETQNFIQHYNDALSGFQRNPTMEATSEAALKGQMLSAMRDTLNKTMESALQGPQYQALRQRYASLSAVEGDVTNALRRSLAKTPGLAERLGDLGFWANAIHGVVTMNPHAIGTAAAIKGSQEINRYLRNPNRAVRRLFDKRAEQPAFQVGQAMGESRQRTASPFSISTIGP
jgi:hypothetical protein